MSKKIYISNPNLPTLSEAEHVAGEKILQDMLNSLKVKKAEMAEEIENATRPDALPGALEMAKERERLFMLKVYANCLYGSTHQNL